MQWDSEGFIDLQGARVWYGIAGRGDSPGQAPLLAIHGGPGMPHDYLEPLAELTTSGRRIVLYDQLGCGQSDHLPGPADYTPDLFVQELATIRRALGLHTVHLYAHSYGGVIALNYMLTQPVGVLSLTLADTFPSVPALVAGWHGLLKALPPDVQQSIRDSHETGVRDDPAAAETFQAHFVDRHVLRGPMTDGLVRSFQKMGGEVYATMHGPRWFQATGTYRDWDVTSRLGEISVPTLVLCGRADQCVPALSEALQKGIPRARLHIFEQSAHLPLLEENAAHQQVLTAFLSEVEVELAS